MKRAMILVLLLMVCGGSAAGVEDRPVAHSNEVLVEETFAEGLKDWVWEGPPGAIVEVTDDGVLIDPRDAEHREGIEGINLWYKRPIAGDWAMEIDLEPIAPRPGDGDKCNLLFMFSSRYEDAELDVIEMSEQRTGHYVLLHAREQARQRHEEQTGQPVPLMRGYTITYYRMNPQSDEPYMMVVRRNPGFHLVGKVMQTIEDQWAYRHTVRIEKRGGNIRLYQNDELVLDETDELGRPWDEGYFGIRSWLTRAKIYGVTVRRLGPGE